MKPFRMILMAGLIVLLLSSGTAYGAGWMTTRLTTTSGDSGSPKIAVDGSAVYVVWTDDTPGNGEIYFRKSIDGGVAWQITQRLTTNAGDSESPAIAVDGSNVYVVWEDATPGIAQIYFMKSEDGGNHWKAARALTNNKTAKAGKPAIAVVGATLYVAWHNDDSAKGGNCWIALTKSADRGVGWQAAKTLSGNSGSADARNPAVAAADSGVYVVWEENTSGNYEIYLRKSTNGGAVWQASVRLTTNSGSSNSPAVAAMGSTVYLAWSDTTPGNPEIYFRKSADQGATWQSGLRLTNNSGRSEAPALAVNDSSLDVVWNDDTPGNFEITHRQSTNGGGAWREIERLTNNSGASCGQSLGVGGSQIFVVWQDLTPGNNEIYIMHKKPDMSPISIILPNASSVWVMGTTEKIKWQIPEGIAGQTAGAASLADLLKIDKVKIDLYKGSTLIKPIVAETSAGAGAYSWMVPAGLADGTDYMVRISSSTDGKVYEDSPPFQIATAALPDLIVYSLTHSPANPTNLNTITVTAVVKNVGAAQAGASTLRLRVASADTTHAIPALAVGATATVTRTVGSLAAATYVATAWADDNNVIAESRETNNSLEDSFVVTGPDLIVYSLTHSPASPTTLNTITVTAVVKNVGAAQAGASTLSLKGGWESTPTTHAIPALAVGATSTVTRTVGPLAAASYVVTAQADVNGAVAESNETNNVKTDSFLVIVPPDLIIQSLTHSPANATMADKNTVTAVVKNAGGSTAGASTLSLSVAGITTSHSVPALAAGATSTVNWNVGQLWAGTYSISAKADVANVVAESNEINNTDILYGWIVSPSPDLVVSLSYDIIGIPGLKYFRVKRVVTNNGPGNAPSSWLDWMVYSPGGSGWGGSYMIDPLAAGESYVFYYNVRLLSQMEAGTWTFTLYSHGVLEWNYANNTATMTYIR